MKIPFSIRLKLLIFIVPLVFIPTLTVAYLSYESSVKSVTSLSCDQQLLQAKTVAERINNVFLSSFADLNLMIQLLAAKRSFKEDKKSHYEDRKLLKAFLGRSPFYEGIYLLNENEKVMLQVLQDKAGPIPPDFLASVPISQIKKGVSISKLVKEPVNGGYVMFFSKPFEESKDLDRGRVLIAFDYDRVLRWVKSLPVGVDGYALLVDQLGRIVAHPRFRPYEYDLSKYSDPGLREFVVDMIIGETVWKRYQYMGERAAACAPIPSMGWSIAVSVPIKEFKGEAKRLRKRTVDVAFFTLILAGMVVVILSYQLLKPVKRLANATERIANGDLDQKIPEGSTDELGMLTRSFNRMVENLKRMRNELVRSQKLIAMGKLSAGVAHEIRNPLNAMKGAIVYIQRKRPQDTLVLEYTRIILEEVERLNRFVTEFLAYARQPPPHLRAEDLNQLVNKTTRLFEERLRKKGIVLINHLGADIPPILMDGQQMFQVISNILINAIDAMSQGGELEISTEICRPIQGKHTPSRVALRVKDNGMGIAEDEIKRIFDPFFSTKDNGTGLGLPISLRIVENHGGRLKVESTPENGTVVTLELPVQ